MKKAVLLVCALAVWGGSAVAQESGMHSGSWGLGWEDGLTLRHRMGAWDLGVAAGPDDYLVKQEDRVWLSTDPESVQGRLELPLDEREEHGWVRLRAGRSLRERGRFGLAAFLGLSYEWIDHQERQLDLDALVGDYDTFELDRFTDYWILEAGLRPSWQLADWVDCEFSFGLRYVWENWDQSVTSTWAGVEQPDHTGTDGDGHRFQDFGWEGVSSLAFVFWL